MTAAPHDPPPAPRPAPTIRSVREALTAGADRELFQREIETTPLHQIGEVLAVWDARACAYALPAHTDVDGGEGLLTDDEVRALLPELRP